MDREIEEIKKILGIQIETEEIIKALGMQIRKHGEIIGTMDEVVPMWEYTYYEEKPLYRFRHLYPLKERRKIKKQLKRIKRESLDEDVKREVDKQLLWAQGWVRSQIRDSLENYCGYCSKLIKDIRKGPTEFITEHPFCLFIGTYVSMIGAFKIYELFNK